MWSWRGFLSHWDMLNNKYMLDMMNKGCRVSEFSNKSYSTFLAFGTFFVESIAEGRQRSIPFSVKGAAATQAPGRDR